MLSRTFLELLLSLLIAQPAMADGDPASDILAPPWVSVYMTVTATDPQLEAQLSAITKRANAAGLPIKVAIIADRTDLGAVPQLWGKPQTYARFLGAELRLNYGGTLLVVMPQGFGIDGPYPVPKALAALSGIDPRSHPTPQRLTDTAVLAVRALTTSAGLKLNEGNSRGGFPMLPIAAVVLPLGAVGAVLTIVWRHKRPRRRLELS